MVHGVPADPKEVYPQPAKRAKSSEFLELQHGKPRNARDFGWFLSGFFLERNSVCTILNQLNDCICEQKLDKFRWKHIW